MSIFDWLNSKVKNLDWVDISLTKLSVAAGILVLAKFWTPILSLDWYWYCIISVAAAIRPLSKVFGK